MGNFDGYIFRSWGPYTFVGGPVHGLRRVIGTIMPPDKDDEDPPETTDVMTKDGLAHTYCLALLEGGLEPVVYLYEDGAGLEEIADLWPEWAIEYTQKHVGSLHGAPLFALDLSAFELVIKKK